jgi:DNA (cytosine-5)-methyltransferase 1
MLVLSLFPGIGLLDRAFKAEGFTVVLGPDVLWGGDIREFRPPAGRFDGIIGGPPCRCAVHD